MMRTLGPLCFMAGLAGAAGFALRRQQYLKHVIDILAGARA